MNVGYSIHPKFHISGGPSILWNYKEDNENFEKPFFAIYNHEVNENNNILIGMRLSLKYVFTEW